VSEPILLSDDENTALILASTRDNVLECAFGIGWVELLPIEANRWAFLLLKQLRSPPPSLPKDGGGA
jgi:hypothetical protein